MYMCTVWTPAYTPGDGQTSWVYSTNTVLPLYISCYVTVNKPVLSYLSLCLLLQWWPWSGCTLCTVHCTLVPCGELATSLLTVKPVGVYSTTLVQYLYISCCLSDNKPVLSYLLLCLLLQWWPRSGCTLCIVHYCCTLTPTVTRWQSSALVALSLLTSWFFVSSMLRYFFWILRNGWINTFSRWPSV